MAGWPWEANWLSQGLDFPNLQWGNTWRKYCRNSKVICTYSTDGIHCQWSVSVSNWITASLLSTEFMCVLPPPLIWSLWGGLRDDFGSTELYTSIFYHHDWLLPFPCLFIPRNPHCSVCCPLDKYYTRPESWERGGKWTSTLQGPGLQITKQALKKWQPDLPPLSLFQNYSSYSFLAYLEP
jgi:hypothetical protein